MDFAILCSLTVCFLLKQLINVIIRNIGTMMTKEIFLNKINIHIHGLMSHSSCKAVSLNTCIDDAW